MMYGSNKETMERKGCTMTREDLLTTYHQYKKNYLEVMGWDMKETFEEWLQRMEDIDSFLIQDNL
jgi:nicotinic acid mononucleotide adenylyltransferase